MKIEFDTSSVKTTYLKLKKQVQDNPLGATAVAAGALNGAAAAANAYTKMKNARTARMNAKSWKTEVNRRTKSK